jgi:FMN reductase
MSWPLRAVAISGSPRAPSKSKTLAELLLQALEKHNCATEMIDVAELPADALVARAQSAAVDAAIEAIGRARIIVAATPTYRALYTGVLKAFFDLMPQAHLRGKICVPVQTGASPAHFLSIEYGLRPLFASLEGVPIAGVYATDEQFEDGKPIEALIRRINDVAMAARALGQITGG